MNERERVRAALAHETPDRIPVDLGASAVTGIHCSVVAELRDYLGLERRPVKVHEPYQMLGCVEPDLQAALELDVTGVAGPATLFGFPNEGWRAYRLPWGQDVLVPRGFQTQADPQGDLLIYPQGDRTAPPSGRMPSGGFFFDTIVRQQPLDEDNLNPEDNLQEFGPIAAADLAHYQRELAAADGHRAILTGLGGTAFGDIALVPAPFLRQPRGVRDIAEWYMTVAARPDYVHAVFSRQCDLALENLARLYEAVGNAIDVLFLCGTDFGTQTSQFLSAATYRDLYHPYYRRMNDWIHAHTTWKTFKHSCGAVRPLIEELIASGFDVLNPVQCSATDMDPAALKAAYGDRLVFWGGGIDTQHTLPFGQPRDVQAEALARCRVFGPGGGFVFNPVHNVQARTPIENLVAMFNGLREYNGQPPLRKG